VTISSGFTGDATLQDGKYKLTRIETISDSYVNENKLGYANENPQKKHLLNKGDILYSNINSISHIGKVAIFQSDANIYHGINLLRLSTHKEHCPFFIFYQLNTTIKKQWAETHANQAVSQASINQTVLSKQTFTLPTLPEQTAIGDFFRKLDNLIKLHS